MLDTKTAAGWRGHELIDRDGDRIGTIGDVYLDRETEQPEWITVKTGLFGTRETFVPIRDAISEGEIVRVPFEKSHVKDAPNIDSDQELSQEDERELYRHYGVDYDQERSGTQMPQAGGQPGQEPLGEGGATAPGGPAGQHAAGDVAHAGQPPAAQHTAGDVGETGSGERGDDERDAQRAPTPAEGERGVAVPGESDRENESDREDDSSAATGDPRDAAAIAGRGGHDREEDLSAGDQRVVEGATTEAVSEQPVGQDREPRLRLKRYVVTEEVRVPVQREEVRLEREE
jgi:sporulation protein YlmC with PRC-barrel domain